jgi:nickel/cobalt transporter (NicO) family protein
LIPRELLILTAAAASIGFIHTVLGPDHYIPFIVIAKARKWSMFKTGWVTFLCGIGHILSSVVLGIIGIALGIAVTRIQTLESFRGNIAGWLLIAFGLIYFAWGLRRAFRKTHSHLHVEERTNLTPWILFTIFVFGPCEPLIPILMYPAARSSIFGIILVTAVFGTVTIGTMMTIVLLSSLGVNLLPMHKFERYTHALAGATICLCGVAIQFLGL